MSSLANESVSPPEVLGMTAADIDLGISVRPDGIDNAQALVEQMAARLGIGDTDRAHLATALGEVIVASFGEPSPSMPTETKLHCQVTGSELVLEVAGRATGDLDPRTGALAVAAALLDSAEVTAEGTAVLRKRV